MGWPCIFLRGWCNGIQKVVECHDLTNIVLVNIDTCREVDRINREIINCCNIVNI